MKEAEPAVIDANVLVYAFDESEGLKHVLASELLEQVLSGNIRGVLTPQILSEFFVTISGGSKKSRVNKPLTQSEAQAIVKDIVSVSNFSVYDLTGHDVLEAIALKASAAVSYWDCLIAAVMASHGVKRIYTEDAGFLKFGGIEVVNPFLEYEAKEQAEQ